MYVRGVHIEVDLNENCKLFFFFFDVRGLNSKKLNIIGPSSLKIVPIIISIRYYIIILFVDFHFLMV